MPSPPPPALDTYRVLEYAFVDEAVGFTGRPTIFVGNHELGRVPCLAICESDDGKALVVHCDDQWESLAAAEHPSVAAAKASLEKRFPGIGAHWKEANVSEDDVERYLDQILPRCSFCGRRAEEFEKLIEGGGARICNDCVDEFHEEMHRD